MDRENAVPWNALYSTNYKTSLEKMKSFRVVAYRPDHILKWLTFLDPARARILKRQTCYFATCRQDEYFFLSSLV